MLYRSQTLVSRYASNVIQVSLYYVFESFPHCRKKKNFQTMYTSFNIFQCGDLACVCSQCFCIYGICLPNSYFLLQFVSLPAVLVCVLPPKFLQIYNLQLKVILHGVQILKEKKSCILLPSCGLSSICYLQLRTFALSHSSHKNQ